MIQLGTGGGDHGSGQTQWDRPTSYYYTYSYRFQALVSYVCMEIEVLGLESMSCHTTLGVLTFEILRLTLSKA